MALDAPYPELDEILTSIGEAGHRLSDIEASEGAAGNISVYLGWPLDPRRRFPIEETHQLPEPAPGLAGGTFVVTGSGRRLREIRDDPAANLGCLMILPDGRTARLCTSSRRLFARLTSEFNSHLAVHISQVARTGTNFNAVVHGQPRHLTYLSHIAAYRDPAWLNRHLLRWQPEAIVNFPEGLGVVPFLIPGSTDLMQATVRSLETHRVVVWAKHGAMARSDHSVKRAVDVIEYAETIAHYEYLDLVNHQQADGLAVEEILAICRAWNVPQTVFPADDADGTR